MKVTDVTAKPDYQITVQFEDGVQGTIRLKELVQKGIFKELKDETAFSKVYTTGYSIAWSEDLEIDALAVYAELLNKNPKDIIPEALNYASD